MNKIRCAVVGVGYLGKFHADKYALTPEAELVAIADVNADARAEVVAKHPHIQSVVDYRELLGKVDAVSIAVPTKFHYEIAKFFLENHVHVLLEKPMTHTVAEAEELIAIAKKNKVILQIGHLERFNPAVRALHDLLPRPLFIESHRLAPFKLRGTDVSVVLDLMIHDIDIIQCIVDSPITKIAANGAPVLSKEIDIANARIQFANGCVANVTAGRVSLKAERKMRIFQQDTYISVDLHNASFAVFRKGEKEIFPGIPEIISENTSFEGSDALKAEVLAFINAIQTKQPPVVSGEDGKKALETAILISAAVAEQLETLKAAGLHA